MPLVRYYFTFRRRRIDLALVIACIVRMGLQYTPDMPLKGFRDAVERQYEHLMVRLRKEFPEGNSEECRVLDKIMVFFREVRAYLDRGTRSSPRTVWDYLHRDGETLTLGAVRHSGVRARTARVTIFEFAGACSLLGFSFDFGQALHEIRIHAREAFVAYWRSLGDHPTPETMVRSLQAARAYDFLIRVRPIDDAGETNPSPKGSAFWEIVPSPLPEGLQYFVFDRR